MKWIGKHIFGFDAIFRQDVTIDGNLTVAGTSTSFGDDDKIILGAGGDGEIYVSSDDLYIRNVTSDKDIIFSINDGGSQTELMRMDGDVSRVGIGIASPLSKLHINGGTGTLSTGLTFGDGDTGFAEIDGDDQISVVLAGNKNFLFQDGVFRANSANGPEMVNETTSSTNPGFVFQGDLDTGMGRGGTNQ